MFLTKPFCVPFSHQCMFYDSGSCLIKNARFDHQIIWKHAVKKHPFPLIRNSIIHRIAENIMADFCSAARFSGIGFVRLCPI